VDEHTERSECRIALEIGAALDAKGGPELSVGPKGVGSVKMSWPDANKSTAEAMGSFIWRCE
jgi:hypothetical protein